MKVFVKVLLLAIISTLLFACTNKEDKDAASSFYIDAKGETITHIHGLGYAGEENTLLFATHHGLLQYSEGQWYKTDGSNHDYMGFQATNDGFYSSGHPMLGSELENPLGLIRSIDEGYTLEKIAFYGESDFHYLAAGYTNHDLYVFNEHPGSSLDVGLYFSDDKGKNWTQSTMKGISANSIGNIATHPTNSGIVSISTNKGLFTSTNFGNDFQLTTSSKPVTTVEYHEDTILYFIVDGENTALMKQNLSDEHTEKIPTPKGISHKNPILFLATHPENREEMTIVSLNNDIYHSLDGGENWKLLVEKGQVPEE